MVMPDDKNITWKNSIGLAGVLAVSYLAALILHTFSGIATATHSPIYIAAIAPHLILDP